MPQQFDYIIVGAGSAGCVLANRLTEDPDTSVLVLETGGNDNSIFIKMPDSIFYTHEHDRSERQTRCWCNLSTPWSGKNDSLLLA